jgi:hypothetical protein
LPPSLLLRAPPPLHKFQKLLLSAASPSNASCFLHLAQCMHSPHPGPDRKAGVPQGLRVLATLSNHWV